MRGSRRSNQRALRRRQQAIKSTEAVESLNWLWGQRAPSNSEVTPNPMQAEVLGRVNFLSGLCHEKGSLTQIPRLEAAFSELLQGRSEYSSDQPTTLAACVLERISLPQSLEGAPAVEDILSEEARRFLQSPEQMLREESTDLSDFQPYWDPLLRGSTKTYKKFIKMLHKAGCLTYTQRPKGFCGVFFVRKSDGQKIRMIIDARGTNKMFKEPPGVDLLTSDGFARVEIACPDNLRPGFQEYERYLTSMGISVGLSDVKDCFHRMKQPKWLSEYFCLNEIPGSWVNLQSTMLDGRLLGPDDQVWPAPGSLCMGFTWSPLQPSRLVHDRSESIVFSTTADQQKETNTCVRRPVHHYVYVDNLGLLSVNHDAVESSLREVEEVFTSHNLILHPGSVSSGSTRALGCELRGDLMASRITPERYHKARQAITARLLRKKVSGRVLEVIVGHCTFAGLMCRPTLSVFNTICRFINAHYDRPSRLWDTVKEELRVFRGLMIFLHADWTRPWNPYVSACDASEQGYGVVSSTWRPEEVAKLGRIPERSRFRKLGCHSGTLHWGPQAS